MDKIALSRIQPEKDTPCSLLGVLLYTWKYIAANSNVGPILVEFWAAVECGGTAY